MELVNRNQYAEKIATLGIRELDDIIRNSKYKMKVKTELIKDEGEGYYMTLKNIEILREKKQMIKRKLSKTQFSFLINIDEINTKDKIALIEYYEKEYNLDLFSMVEYNIGVEDILQTLAILHEVGHIKKLLIDFSKHGYLKDDVKDAQEANLFNIKAMFIFVDKEKRVFDEYRKLNREKYADDFSVEMFKKHFNKIVEIYN